MNLKRKAYLIFVRCLVGLRQSTQELKWEVLSSNLHGCVFFLNPHVRPLASPPFPSSSLLCRSTHPAAIPVTPSFNGGHMRSPRPFDSNLEGVNPLHDASHLWSMLCLPICLVLIPPKGPVNGTSGVQRREKSYVHRRPP